MNVIYKYLIEYLQYFPSIKKIQRTFQVGYNLNWLSI